MRILSINIGGTEFKSNKITVYHAREALKIQKEALKVAQKGESVDQKDLGAIAEMLEDFDAVYDREVCLLCDVYGDQFTASDVERELGEDELNAAVNAIIGRVTGVMEKNL